MKIAIVFATFFFFNGFVVGNRFDRFLSDYSLEALGGDLTPTTGLATTEVSGGAFPSTELASKKNKAGMLPATTGSGGGTLPATGGSGGTFNVKEFGAKGDGKSDDCKGFEAAWAAACKCSGTPRVWIPKGTFLTGPVNFVGPCNAQTITVQLDGTVLGSTNLAQFAKTDWITIGKVNGLILTGTGTIDGQGSVSWGSNKCPQTKNCKVLPTSLKFNKVVGGTVRGITLVNSKMFHVGVLCCENMQIIGIKVTAPEDSPNTDGIHIERSVGVSITNSVIGVGDDCVSIGHGNSQITVTGITCGPGHGISVGSLGRYPYEENVRGLLVKNCTLIGTMFGARIKSWENSPGATVASNITFEDITMKNVKHPIIIDQTYCPFSSCANQSPSKVKLQDIFFRNIKGTSATPEAVVLECSKGVPCNNVVVENVHLEHASGAKVTSTCLNAKAKFVATQFPPPCP